MPNIYDDPTEQLLHTSMIKRLADELNRPVDEVRGVYEGEMVRLKSNARVKTFIAVIAARCTREKVLANPH